MNNHTKQSKISSIFETKTIDKTGIFTGYASVFDVEDYSGDIIKKGAFKNLSTEIKLLWQHNADQPIGKILEMTETSIGLYIKANIILDLQIGREAYLLMQSNIVNGLSIGYIPIEYYYEGKTRIITEIEMIEISVVTFPANNRARITEVKNKQSIENKIFTKIKNIHDNILMKL